MSVEPGEVRRKVLLRTTATYRVLAVEGDHVVVEVLESPGLAAGERYRFTLAAVAGMELVAPG